MAVLERVGKWFLSADEGRTRERSWLGLHVGREITRRPPTNGTIRQEQQGGSIAEWAGGLEGWRRTWRRSRGVEDWRTGRGRTNSDHLAGQFKPWPGRARRRRGGRASSLLCLSTRGIRTTSPDLPVPAPVPGFFPTPKVYSAAAPPAHWPPALLRPREKGLRCRGLAAERGPLPLGTDPLGASLK
ncbi:hypothetical protein BO71DRAFT_481145 [Aspergillus ellipticus CBS 707.79]|uniref:Uncharacterized protein n=1 Tax=Aspergillus ellipticus CBS 707.79 TaxID=1448320 RepID=A0A319DLB4_9EURO|nr:hypothetical protein BO71DRAFT_481145 [Aspergillus ellipticus CBS 707.79]